MKFLDIIAAVLLIIGGLNWGLVGIFSFNLVDFLFSGTGIERIIYILVGLSAIWQIFNFQGIQERWGSR